MTLLNVSALKELRMVRQTAYALMLMFSGLSIAQPAAAATILITYTGTVSSGTDIEHVFGRRFDNLTGTPDLTGLAFTSVYTLTYPTPGAQDISGTGYHQISGGTSYGNSVISLLSGKFTINGHTVFIDGNERGGQDLGSPANAPSVYNGYYSQISDVVGSKSLAHLFNTVSSTSGDNFISSLNFADALNHTVTSSDFSDGAFNNGLIGTANISARLKNLAVSVQEVSAVPEPATWGMMIFGFGIAGVTLRVRRRETALA